MFAPLSLDRGPFRFGEDVGAGSCAVVFACSDEVFGVIAAREIPVCAQGAAGGNVECGREVRFRKDGEVSVAEFDSPFVGWL